jgi:hypothetical protein
MQYLLRRLLCALNVCLNVPFIMLLISQDILIPSHKYFEMSQFDAARTNVNYITRQLGIRKSIGAAVIEGAELCDDAELVEEASELAAVADSTFTNYDSSIYTVIFIPPGEDLGLPKGSEKYFEQVCVLTTFHSTPLMIAVYRFSAQGQSMSVLSLCVTDDVPMFFPP